MLKVENYCGCIEMIIILLLSKNLIIIFVFKRVDVSIESNYIMIKIKNKKNKREYYHDLKFSITISL